MTHAIPFELYLSEVREGVCFKSICFRRSDSDSECCVNETNGSCPVFTHLSDVIGAIKGLESDSIVPYEKGLRMAICSKCKNQDANGNCELRERDHIASNGCLLNAYFPVIVNCIERVQQHYVPPSARMIS